MDKKKFTVIGGDQRSLKMADLLLDDGNDVRIYGFDKIENKNIQDSDSLYNAIKDADVVIGPLPLTNEDENLNAPFHSGKLQLNEIFDRMTSSQIFTAGKIEESTLYITKDMDIHILDYFAREEMQILNAIPTAEGAIQIAMEEMPITIYNSNAVVLGFGRIGKTLSKMLYGLGANTNVAVRKYSDIAWIKSYGYNPIIFKELDKYLPKIDVAFNTIPSEILNKDKLKKLNKGCLIIDLASKPGGVDVKCAEELGIKVIWALALPGKVAPVTAAKVIKETIYNIIEELGV